MTRKLANMRPSLSECPETHFLDPASFYGVFQVGYNLLELFHIFKLIQFICNNPVNLKLFQFRCVCLIHLNLFHIARITQWPEFIPIHLIYFNSRQLIPFQFMIIRVYSSDFPTGLVHPMNYVFQLVRKLTSLLKILQIFESNSSNSKTGSIILFRYPNSEQNN